MTDEQLAQFSYFSPFIDGYESLYAPITQGNSLRSNDADGPYTHLGLRALMGVPEEGDEEVDDGFDWLRQNSVKWRLLGSAIPVRSFAAGSNSITSIEETSLRSNSNFNMQEMRTLDDNDDVYWGRSNTNWKHGDLKDMALPYVSQVWQKFIELNEEGN